MVTAFDDVMMPSWNVAQLIKYIKTKLGFQTTNIHESDPLGYEIYGN